MPVAECDSATLHSCVELGLADVFNDVPPCAKTCAAASIHVAGTCDAPVRKVEVEECSMQSFKR